MVSTVMTVPPKHSTDHLYTVMDIVNNIEMYRSTVLMVSFHCTDGIPTLLGRFPSSDGILPQLNGIPPMYWMAPINITDDIPP